MAPEMSLKSPKNKFFDKVQTADVKFDCSMLQTQFRDVSGAVAWRSVSCDEDEDDFSAALEQVLAAR